MAGFLFRLELEGGTAADPPSFETAVPTWRPGDTIPLGRRTLRVVDVRDDDADKPPMLVVRECLNHRAASVTVCLMLCRLALALVCGLALAGPSLADSPPPPTPIHDPPLPQADWKLVAGYSTWKPEKRNRIFYARVPAQTTRWKLHVYETEETRKALHLNFSRYGLLAVFLSSWEPGSTIAGVYLAEDGALNVQIRAAPPPEPPDCPPTVPPGGPDAPCPVSLLPGPGPEYRLIAIRKGSLPAPVKRLYIAETS